MEGEKSCVSSAYRWWFKERDETRVLSRVVYMTGSAELGRQCTAGTKWDQERTPAVHHTRSELGEMLRDRFRRTGTGQPDTSGTTAAPFQTNRRTFSGAESEYRDPPCRRPQIDPAIPMQIRRRSRWRAGCPTGPSTRRSMSNGRRGMQTKAAEAGQLQTSRF